MNIPDKFIKEGARKVIITSLTRHEAMRYSKELDLKIRPQSKLVITRNGFQHLLDAGHITGTGKDGRYDVTPLSYKDFKKLNGF